MYIIPIAWLYVALMMGIAEATHSSGTVLGGLITFVLYGVGPVALVLYLMGSPARRRAIKAREAAELTAAQTAAVKDQVTIEAPDHSRAHEQESGQPDAGGHAATDLIAPVREKP
jgi:hypothetical protein